MSHLLISTRDLRGRTSQLIVGQFDEVEADAPEQELVIALRDGDGGVGQQPPSGVRTVNQASARRWPNAGSTAYA